MNIDINADLIVRAAKAFVEQWDDTKVDMHAYYTDEAGVAQQFLPIKMLDKPFCNTSTCFAGAMPFLDIGTDELKPVDSDIINGCLDYASYSKRILGVNGGTVWHFIFAPTWPNKTRSCLKRAEFLKENEHLDMIDLCEVLRNYAYERD